MNWKQVAIKLVTVCLSASIIPFSLSVCLSLCLSLSLSLPPSPLSLPPLSLSPPPFLFL